MIDPIALSWVVIAVFSLVKLNTTRMLFDD